MSSKFDVWGLYARRVEAHEVAAIQASPVQHRPLPNEVSAYFPIPLLHARFEMHGQVDPILRLIAKNGNNMTSNLSAFGLAMRLSEFELRHRFVQSWPGFALLMRKLLGVENAHWFPSLFLCAVGAPAMPQPRFELYEVLGFHAKLAASAPEAASNTFARAS